MCLQRRRAITTTTTEDTPVFDRNKVSLEIPSAAFGTGFTLVTNISKVLSSVIMVSERRKYSGAVTQRARGAPIDETFNDPYFAHGDYIIPSVFLRRHAFARSFERASNRL